MDCQPVPAPGRATSIGRPEVDEAVNKPIPEVFPDEGCEEAGPALGLSSVSTRVDSDPDSNPIERPSRLSC